MLSRKMRGMGLTHLTKNESAKKELARKGMAPERDRYPSKID